MTVHTGPRGHGRSHLPFESPPPASVPRTHGRSHVQHTCVRERVCVCVREHTCVREHRRPPGPAHPTTCSSTTAAVAKDGPPRRSAVGAIRPPGSGSAAGGRSSPVPACCGHSSTSGTARGPAGSRGTAECGRRQAAPAQDTRASQQSCRRPPGSARLCASGRGQDKARGPPPPMPCTPPSGVSFSGVQLHPEPVYGLGARFHSPFLLWGNPATTGKTGPGDFSGKARASDTSGWNLRSARPSDGTWRRVQVFDGLIVELLSSVPAVPTGLLASLTFY